MNHPLHLVFNGDVGGPEGYHVGDEAMLEANLAAFRRRCPELQATIVSRNPAWTAARHAVRSIAPIGFATHATSDETRNVLLNRLLENFESAAAEDSWGREAIALMAAADGVVVSGGGNLSATWPEHVYERVAYSEMAHRLGKPCVFLGQTIGPDLSPVLEPLLALALQRAKIVGVRELCSAALALNLGVSPDCLIYQTDDALSLEETPVDEAWADPLRRGGRPWIAVTIDPFAAAEEAAPAVNSLAAQLSHLATYSGAQLVFIPHVAAATHENGVRADLVIGQAIRDALPASTSMIMCDVLEASQTRWLTGQADLVVSTRYHPLVFGMAAGTPGLGLYTDEYRRVKLQGALAHANLAKCCISLQEAIDEGRLFEMGRTLWDHREEMRHDLVAMNRVWRDHEAIRWQMVFAAFGLPDANASRGCEITPSADANRGFAVQPLVRRLLDELEARRRSMVAERFEAARRWTQTERYAQSLLAEQLTLKTMCAESERYALSLQTEHCQLSERFGEVERYALSLEKALNIGKRAG